MNLGFRYESEMTDLAAAAAPWWWLRGLQHDFVAAEIVGPNAVADLVGIRFDQRRLGAREAEGIAPVVDALALHALRACRGHVMSTSELAEACHVTSSGIGRALAIAVDANAMIRRGRGRYACHPAWAPVGARMVAVELKLENWRRAFDQAQSYACWANATWVVLARVPPAEARAHAAAHGMGLAVLGSDGMIERLVRPHTIRRPRVPWAALWAGEQALARALSAGYRSESATTVTALPAKPQGAPVASLRSA